MSKQVIQTSNEQNIAANSLNYLEHPVIKAYFIAQEHIAYRCVSFPKK